MRHLKLLGLTLLTVFALGAMLASAASATEPAGVLFLGTETGPVSISSTQQAVTTELVTAVGTLKCTSIEISSSNIGAAGETHVTLGELNIRYTGCKFGEAQCSSVNTKGEKDPGGTILQAGVDTDLHFISLENSSGVLLPATFIGFLELEKKLDLTVNCAGVKILILGATSLEAKSAKDLTKEDVSELELQPSSFPCDKNDKLCMDLFPKWSSKECPLAAKVLEEEECVTLKANKPVVVKLSKMVLIDF